MENQKAIHISILAIAVLLFFIYSVDFLTNINLMLFPEKNGNLLKALLVH